MAAYYFIQPSNPPTFQSILETYHYRSYTVSAQNAC